MGKKTNEYSLEDVVRLKGGFFKSILKRIHYTGIIPPSEEDYDKSLEDVLNYFKYLINGCALQGYDCSSLPVMGEDFPFLQVAKIGNRYIAMLRSADGSFKPISAECNDFIFYYGVNKVVLDTIGYLTESGSDLNNAGYSSEFESRLKEKFMQEFNGLASDINDDHVINKTEELDKLLKQVQSDERFIEERRESIDIAESEIRLRKDSMKVTNDLIQSYERELYDHEPVAPEDFLNSLWGDQITKLVNSRVAFPIASWVKRSEYDDVYNILFAPFADVTCHAFNPALDLDTRYNFGRLGVLIKFQFGKIINVKVLPTDERYMMTRSHHFHPNISSSGEPCLGTGADDFLEFRKSMKVFDLVNIIYNMLRTYSPDNPYCQHIRFDKLTLKRKAGFDNLFSYISGSMYNYATMIPEESEQEQGEINESSN